MSWSKRPDVVITCERLVYHAPLCSVDCQSDLFEMSSSTHVQAFTVSTHLEQLQYDLCECSTKSQAPTFSVSSSSQVPLVVAENFRLETGGGKKNNFKKRF